MCFSAVAFKPLQEETTAEYETNLYALCQSGLLRGVYICDRRNNSVNIIIICGLFNRLIGVRFLVVGKGLCKVYREPGRDGKHSVPIAWNDIGDRMHALK
jgi:hypothetical protein